MIGRVRMPFLVTVLVGLAVVAAVLAAGFFLNFIPATGGGVAAGSNAPRTFLPASAGPSQSFTATTPPTAGPTAVPTAAPTPGGTYTVQPGDTLSGIAAIYGVSWQEIAAANADKVFPPDYVITPGMVLAIPTSAQKCPGYETYTVQAGDNLIDIATQFDVDWTDLADFNNVADAGAINAGDVLCIPAAGWSPLPSVPEE
jgi:LysM repeat protein